MKALLWKDYRQNRQLLLAAGILFLLPYAFVIVMRCVEILRFGQGLDVGWARDMEGASIASMGISVVLCAFIAGNAVAGERADRSAEFAAYLPIPRRSAIASKAITAVCMCLLMLLLNSLIFTAAWLVQERTAISHVVDNPDALDVAVNMAITAVFIFGVSWLLSTLLRSPAMAAAGGIVAVIVLFMGLLLVEELRGAGNDEVERSYALLCLLLGSGCFLAGVVCYLRGVEA